MVKILFYTSSPHSLETEIVSIFALCVVNTFQFHSVYNPIKLKQVFQNEVYTKPIVILAPMSHQDLDDLSSLQELYTTLPVVLLLPDESDETLQKAHKFQPKFLTTVKHDFTYVLSVVEQLSMIYCHD